MNMEEVCIYFISTIICVLVTGLTFATNQLILAVAKIVLTILILWLKVLKKDFGAEIENAILPQYVYMVEFGIAIFIIGTHISAEKLKGSGYECSVRLGTALCLIVEMCYNYKDAQLKDLFSNLVLIILWVGFGLAVLSAISAATNKGNFKNLLDVSQQRSRYFYLIPLTYILTTFTRPVDELRSLLIATGLLTYIALCVIDEIQQKIKHK